MNWSIVRRKQSGQPGVPREISKNLGETRDIIRLDNLTTRYLNTVERMSGGKRHRIDPSKKTDVDCGN